MWSVANGSQGQGVSDIVTTGRRMTVGNSMTGGKGPGTSNDNVTV